MRGAGVAPKDRAKTVETILTELSRLQGLARSVDETFVAFLIGSAQRETGVRLEELTAKEAQSHDAPVA